jgi:hypothetical protein
MVDVRFSDPTTSEDDVETRQLIVGGATAGVVKAYKATEEEAKTIKGKLKKKIKPGQVFSAKVFLEKEIDETTTEAVAAGVRGVYADLEGKVYFVVKTHDGIVPLRVG